MTGLLVVTAVPAEAEAVRAGLTDPTITVAPLGVG
ncbi:futalosine hydrolase, partial [Micromonospora globispora]